MRTIAVTLIATEMILLTSMIAFGDTTKGITIESLDPTQTVSDALKNCPSNCTCFIFQPQPPQPPQPPKRVCNWFVSPDDIDRLLLSQPK